MEDSGRFIGGAAKARKNAQKRIWQPKDSTLNKALKIKSNYTPKRKGYNPTNIYYAAILDVNVQELLESNQNDELIKEICWSAKTPSPEKLPCTFRDSNHYHSMLSSLVLEESRFIIAEALIQSSRHKSRSFQSYKNNNNNNTIFPPVRLEAITEKKKKKEPDYDILQFKRMNHSNRDGFFTPAEIYHIRPGSIFQIELPALQQHMDNHERFILGVVTPNAPELSLSVFRTSCTSCMQVGQVCRVQPITTVISEQRMFCANWKPANISMYPKILGWKDPVHIRFNDDDDDEEEDEENENCCESKKSPTSDTNGDENVKQSSKTKEYSLEEEKKEDENIVVAGKSLGNILNTMQEEAASKFLHSSTGMTLVQGPPGTGKTTFMVEVVLRSLLLPGTSTFIQGKRVLVTAPTNKAVNVLATRFLQNIKDDNSLNVVMIGVEDKLLGDDDGSHDAIESNPSSADELKTLRSIFIYTWLDDIIATLQLLGRQQLIPSSTSTIDEKIKAVQMSVTSVKKKLERNLPNISYSCGAMDSLASLVHSLENSHDRHAILNKAMNVLPKIIFELKSIKAADSVKELLSTAQVIFCTLSTSGVSAMKQTNVIDDLFVDEAGCCSEAEFVIPLHLKPKRILAVGDPKQLPATVMSPLAKRFGFDRSILDRLMIENGREYTMLNIQYRMKPQIAAFPSKMFYDGKLLNGPNVESESYQGKSQVLNGKPYTFLQISGSESHSHSGSLFNISEARCVVELVKMIRGAYIHSNKSSQVDARNSTNPCDNGDMWCSPERLRIITFYTAQTECIRRQLNEHGLGRALVATVDSSQGCEADIIIVSFVRSNFQDGKASKTGFLQDNRRLNVALTRAKFQLICVGDAQGTLSSSGVETLKTLIDDATSQGVVVSNWLDMVKKIPQGAEVDSEDKQATLVGLKRQLGQLDAVKGAADLRKKKKKLLTEIQSVQKHVINVKRKDLLKDKENKLKKLKHELSFAGSDVMMKKGILLSISKLQKEIVDLKKKNLQMKQ